MYPKPSENRPFIFSFVENKEIEEFVKACIFLCHHLTEGHNEQASELMNLIHSVVTTCPRILEEVKNYEGVGLALNMMSDCVAQNNVHTAQLKRDLLCMSYFCYSNHMRYYECVCEAIQMRAGLLLSKKEQFTTIIRALLKINSTSITEEKNIVERSFNKLVFADLNYAVTQDEFDEDYRSAYNYLKKYFSDSNEQNIIREGDALHKKMFDTLKRLYINDNEFSYMALE